MYAATYDKRVKAVIVQSTSLLNGAVRRAADLDRWDAGGSFLQFERAERYRADKVVYIKVLASDDEPCVLPCLEVFDAYISLKEQALNWRSEVTFESFEKVCEFHAIKYIKMIAPATLLVIAAKNDGIVPISAMEAAFEKAL